MKQSMKHLAAALALCLPFAAGAHDVWVVPSSTVLSGADSWITVDAAVGNDKFHFNHAPLRLDGLAVTAPDGSAAEAENLNRGKLRSTFDLQLKQSGTYRVAVVNDGVFARWKEDGKPKRYFGKPEGMAQAVPAKADELEVSQSLGRVETFVTAGKPSAVKPVGRGLELAPVTHPNDLYAGETATFQMLLDGQPAPDLEMTIVAGGIAIATRSARSRPRPTRTASSRSVAAAGPVLGRGRHGRRQGQRAAGQAPPVLRRHLRSAQALIRLKAQAAMSAPVSYAPGRARAVARVAYAALPSRPAPQAAALAGATMGTTWSARLALPAGCAETSARQAIQAALDEVVAEMSTWEDHSDITRYNRAGPAARAAGFWHVLTHALALAEESGGA